MHRQRVLLIGVFALASAFVGFLTFCALVESSMRWGFPSVWDHTGDERPNGTDLAIYSGSAFILSTFLQRKLSSRRLTLAVGTLTSTLFALEFALIPTYGHAGFTAIEGAVMGAGIGIMNAKLLRFMPNSASETIGQFAIIDLFVVLSVMAVLLVVTSNAMNHNIAPWR